MDNQKPTIVLVLRSGGDFSFRDVELITRHINGKWQSETRPRIICLWDKATTPYDLGNVEFIPLTNEYKGTWSRIQLYSPEMEKYKPFLYIDLDTAVILSLENIFKLVSNPLLYISLEDFWQHNQLATGLVWFPVNCKKTDNVWKAWESSDKTQGFRMDLFLRKEIKPDLFWQQLTTTIYDFKPKPGQALKVVPPDAAVICFHGKPRIHDAGEASMYVQWVRDYINQEMFDKPIKKKRVTIIIPYKEDRGWLKDAVCSVPEDVQLILSQGDGNWPENFNKALPQAEGEFIKYLHEDDMLTENCIRDSIRTLEQLKVDFIHGDAIELKEKDKSEIIRRSANKNVTLGSLLKKNTIHSATLMYRREIFDRIGGFDETLNNQEEYEFNLRCLQHGFKIGYCETPLAIYRRHSAQKIRNITKEEIIKEKTLVQSKYQ